MDYFDSGWFDRGLIIAGIELGRHALLWRVVDIESQVVFPSERTEPQVAIEAVRTGYHTSVDVGLAITVIALVIWVFMLLQSIRRPIRLKF